MRNRNHEFAFLHLLLTTIFGLFSTASGQNACSIEYKQPDRRLPFINSHVRGILYPVNNWTIEVQLGETFEVVCTGLNNALNGTELTHLNATCLPPGNISPDIKYKCVKKMTETVLGPVKRCGFRGNTKIFHIGWSLPNGRFLRQVEVCFNTWSSTTEYTKHILVGSMFHDTNLRWLEQPEIRNLSRAYDVYKNLNKTVTALLNNSTLAEAYVGGQNTLTGVSLIPAGDFNTQTWKDATYNNKYMVPMWKALKDSTWKTLGDHIRRKASEGVPRNFVIYTGTHGVLKLVDGEKNLVHIHLDNGTNGPTFSVPEHIWKVVYDQQRNEAVAFVLLNHPNNPQYPIPKPPLLCPNICDRIRSSLWENINDVNKWRIYCCTVQSLKSRISNIPVPQNVELMFAPQNIELSLNILPKHTNVNVSIHEQ